MPLIKIPQKKMEFEVPKGANLMDVLIAHGLPVASSCDGGGVCARCKVKVLSGIENLSPRNRLEELIVKRDHLSKSERLTCQTSIEGDVTVSATYW